MKDRLARFTGLHYRFFTALSVTIPFLLIHSLPVKGALFLLLYLLLPLSGKRIRFLTGGLLFASVLFFQLLSPRGEVLWEGGPFLLTKGALEEGLLRGMTLLGLVNLSLISIRPGIKLPGEGGALLARTLFYFGQFMDMRDRIKGKIAAKGLAGEMDLIMEEVYASGHEAEGESDFDRKGKLYLLTLSLLFWGGFIWERLICPS
ncbi:MAG: hypothetical protein PQJ59_13730 [Spirochaetales bacterium]|nr:hypothetical protein [Spirochaetales bacterium]